MNLAKSELLRDLQTLTEVSNTKAAWFIARQWIVIVAMVLICIVYPFWPVFILAALVFVAKQHALGILMHEAVHYRLSTNRSFNEIIGNIFCAYPLLISVDGYRAEHLPHHKGTNTEADPYYRLFQQKADWQWPKTRRQAAKVLFCDLFMVNIVDTVMLSMRWSPLRPFYYFEKLTTKRIKALIPFSCYWAAVIYLSIVFHFWPYLILLWILPLVSLLMFFIRIRVVAEHPFAPSRNEFADTRQVRGRWIEQVFIAPLNSNYHLVHHLFPSIPQYNLPRAHEILMQNDVYRNHIQMYDSYWFGEKPVFAKDYFLAGASAQ